MLAPVLKAAGYAVTPVASAEDALALLRSGRRFDVIITDIEMPGMDGFELASAVHAHPAAADVPIIGLSTWCRRRRSSAAGASASTTMSPSSTVRA